MLVGNTEFASPVRVSDALEQLNARIDQAESILEHYESSFLTSQKSFNKSLSATHEACALLETLVLELERDAKGTAQSPLWQAGANENLDDPNLQQLDESMSVDIVPTPPSLHGQYAESEADSPAPAPPTTANGSEGFSPRSSAQASPTQLSNDRELAAGSQKLTYSAYSLSPFNPHRYKQMMMVPPSTGKPLARAAGSMPQALGNNPFLAPVRDNIIELNRKPAVSQQASCPKMLSKNVSSLPVDEEVTIAGYKGMNLLSLETPLAHVSTMARSMASFTPLQKPQESEQRLIQPLQESEYAMLPNYVRLQLDLSFLNSSIQLINEYLCSSDRPINSFFAEQLERLRFCDPMKVKPILIALVHTDRLKSKSTTETGRQYFLE